MSLTETGPVATRDPDLVLARLHLRLGSLALARAELETLAGRDGLDESGIVDLAEARWRTGDITGAGEAAMAALHDDEGPLLALVIAAEAAAARGRPTESRRLAERAMAQANGSIDAVFAGMPRAGAWPPDAAAPPPSPTTMFDPPRRATSPVHRHPMPHAGALSTAAAGAAGAGQTPLDERAPGAGAEADAATVGLWDAATGLEPAASTSEHAIDEAADVTADVASDAVSDEAAELPAGDVELDLGRAALEANDPDEAVLRLGLVLRFSPALAPAVLELIEGRAERGLAIVRGDAYRLVGREIEARRAFAEAAGASSPLADAMPLDATPPDATPPDQSSEGDPE